MKYIFLMLTLITLNAHAEENYLYTGAWSKHFNGDDGYNETHDLLMFQSESFVVGGFRNSYGHKTVLLGKNYGREYNNFSVGLVVAGTYGYYQCYGGKRHDNDERNLCPALIPNIVYTKYKLQPSLLIFGDQAAAISIRWEM